MNTNNKISQNFLTNKDLVKKLIKVSDLSKEDLILDIGVGKGIITECLSLMDFGVLGFEPDTEITPTSIKELNNVEIKNIDFLSYDLRNLKNYSVWSNIPYNLTSKITQKLLITDHKANKVCLIIQEESAERLLGIKEGLLISLLILNNYESKILYKFKKSDFSPKPRVNSVLIEFTKRSKPLIEQANFSQFLDFICFIVMQQKPSILERLEKILNYKAVMDILSLLKIDRKASLYQVDKLKFFQMFEYFISNYQNKLSIIKGSYHKYQEINSRNQKVYRTRLAQK